MEKTWISKLLPKDEYREKRMLYFFTEAAIILGVLLVLYTVLALYIPILDIPGSIIALLSFMFLMTYITIRSILTGIEHPDVATEKRFKKQKRTSILTAISFMGIFIISSLLIKGIPSNVEDVLDIIGPAFLAAIFFFIINYVSLKKSYKKNKELLDD